MMRMYDEEIFQDGFLVGVSEAWVETVWGFGFQAQ